MNELVLSHLGHTWILDLDGTILKHNGYLIDGKDSFLPGARDFLRSIPEKDMVIFISSRKKCYKKQSVEFLKENGIRYDYMIFEAPYGERIVINDKKPSGLVTAQAVSINRNGNFDFTFIEDESI